MTLILICASLLSVYGRRSLLAQRGTASALIREEQSITIDGVAEVWRLEWRTPPIAFCSAQEGPPTCPCDGFAYGESGDLDLVRMRNGREIERLSLGKLFSDFYKHKAVVQRWQPTESDVEKYVPGNRQEFAAEIRKRLIAKVMNFGDYDHDGQATEFFIQTESLACGHQYGVVVGVSKRNPRLHAFGTALHPAKPLQLKPHEWQALLNASGPVRVVDLHCADHGSETEIELQLYATADGIRVNKREFECTEKGRGRLIKRSTE